MDPSPYAEQRYRDGLECALRATQYDQEGHLSGAMTFYSEAVAALRQACSLAPVFSPILSRVDEYARRAEEIRAHLSTQQVPQRPVPGSVQERDKRVMHQIEYLMELAVMDDEGGRNSEAQKMYTCAIDVALRSTKQLADESVKLKVKTITSDALSRLEQLKLEEKKSKPSAPSLDDLLKDIPDPPKTRPQETSIGRGQASAKKPPKGPLVSFLDADDDLTRAPKFNAYGSGTGRGGGAPRGRRSPSPSRRPPPSASSTMEGRKRKGAAFTNTELKVLRAMSVINGVTYLPWSDTDLVELRAISSIASEFEDPDGLPRLADKQRAQFQAWVRPEEICELPKMVHLISSFTIKQTLIGDCSFLASLAVCADYERRFKTRLVTRCIHPKNRRGDPIINPHGKYFISFNLNGCRRKVVIDDRLPMGRYNELLCSYSSNHDEFWISLIEKAYMKVMGGYDFPGSSSNIDLHALTGWIPERVSMKNADDAMFKKMEQSMRKGEALMTVATGVMSETQAERAGLVPTHAYAVLSVVEIKGLKLLQLKNPWSHRRWKGNFSEHDRSHWTPELRRALDFDQMEALQVDNGVFWIDWSSLKQFFDVIYLNWKPELYRYKSTLHDFWKPGDVEKDVYNISNNPQYALRVNCSGQSASVWVLLSRHITTKSDFANNEKFITIHIAKSNGQRILFPEKFLVQGIKINTPHYLAKLEGVPRGSSSYTIIVSQLESLSTIHYTLRVYSTCEFSVTPVPNPYAHSKQLKGEWKPGQQTQPKFFLTTASVMSQVFVKLQAPKELFVRLEMKSESRDVSLQKANSGDLRPGFTAMEVADVPKGTFAVMPVTYSPLPGKVVPFLVTVSADNVFNFNSGQP